MNIESDLFSYIVELNPLFRRISVYQLQYGVIKPKWFGKIILTDGFGYVHFMALRHIENKNLFDKLDAHENGFEEH